MWIELGMAALLLLGLLQSALLMLLWRRLHLLQQGMGLLARHAAQAQTDVPTAMLVTALGRLERRIELMQPSTRTGPSCDLAQQLARDGADVEQLMARCGLSRDEARLIRQLHPAAG